MGATRNRFKDIGDPINESMDLFKDHKDEKYVKQLHAEF